MYVWQKFSVAILMCGHVDLDEIAELFIISLSPLMQVALFHIPIF
jgi:hypothetical protein